jgi:hypothetical protein
MAPRSDSSGATSMGIFRSPQCRAGQRNLRSVNLAETAVLRGLTRLRVLEITRTKVSDAAVDRLQQALPNLWISR